MFKSLAKGRLRVAVATAALTVAAFATGAEFTGSHPDSYVVRKGDTLWDISAKFLKKPWLWPEIWQANPQIANPHLIYPGDVISLAYLNRVGVNPGPRNEAPINAINLSDVESFLKDLSVVDSYDGLPHVVAIEEDRLRGNAGKLVYVRGLSGAQPGQRYSVVRPTLRYTQTRLSSNGKYLGYTEDLDWRGQRTQGRTVDMQRNWSTAALSQAQLEPLGHELAKVSTGSVTKVGADVTSVLLDDEYREVRPGDRLVPVQAQPYDLQFFPHAPRVAQPLGKLQIAAVADGLLYGGNKDVVAISGGSREGIDNGTVFSVWRDGSTVVDRVKHGDYRDEVAGKGNKVQLPDEYVSHVMVFRTFEKVSYGLVMQGSRPTRVGHTLKHPDATE